MLLGKAGYDTVFIDSNVKHLGATMSERDRLDNGIPPLTDVFAGRVDDVAIGRRRGVELR